MSYALTPETEAVCAAYRRAIEAGECPGDAVLQLATMRNVQRPAIWRRLRAGGVLPQYNKRSEGGKGRPIGSGVRGYSEARRNASIAAKNRVYRVSPDYPDAQRVDRDPCPRCGVRRDYGCHHSLAPLGIIL